MSETTHPPVDGRTLHYGEFYGIKPLPPEDGRPLAFVLGTCQSEALRLLLDSAPTPSLRTVRVPPIYELDEDELPHLRRLLARTDVLFVQPVSDNYRGMPLGTSQLTPWLAPGAQLVLLPLLVYEGMHPFQVTVRHPSAGDPPVVPYHDLRTIVEAHTGTRPEPTRDLDAYRQMSANSIAELRRREQAGDLVVMSDCVEQPGLDSWWTINHPGNVLLVELARRAQGALGVPVGVREPDRVLLNSVHTPVEPVVARALAMSGKPRRDWLLQGEVVPDERVRSEQLRWYARYPGFVQEGIRRYADRLALLGLT